MYFEVQHVPNEVTVEEMDAYISSLLLCKINGVGFDPIIPPTGKTFYFHGPNHMSEHEIINKLKFKYMKGHRLRIYTCKDIRRVVMLKDKKHVWIKQPATVSNNNEHTDTQNVDQLFKKNIVNEINYKSGNVEKVDENTAIILKTCKALFNELFDRYPGLDEINTKSNNVLGYEIFSEVKKRVTQVLQNVTETIGYYGLTEEYRSVHPHETDFALVEMCHSKCDDTPLPPENVLAIDTLALENSFPFPLVPEKKLGWATTFYSAHITKQLRKHIQSLDDNSVGENSTEEEKATALVRKHLKATTSDMDNRVKTWMSKFLKFTQQAVIRVYGIPRLPNLENLTMLVTARGAKSQLATGDGRNFPYNCAVFEAHRHMLGELLALSGNSLDGCILLVRLQIRKRIQRQARHIHAIHSLLRAAADPADGDEWEDL